MARVLKSGWLTSLIALICLLGSVQSTFATTVIMPSDDEMIIEARAIVRGRVLGIQTGLDEQQNRIYTYITLRVQEVLKGQIAERRIVLREPGGQYGNRGSVVFGVPEFQTGENVLLYLDTWADGSLRVHHMLLGKFSVIEDPSTGKFVAVRNAPDETGVQVVGQSSRGPITNRMELSSYTEMVRNRLEANLAAAQEFDTRAYANVPVLARPSAFISGNKKGDLQAQFHLWNPPSRFFEADTGQSVVFKTNTDSAPPLAESDVAAATNCWSAVPGCTLRVVDGGTTTGCGLFVVDGENTVSFNNCDGYFSGSGTCSAGVLAVTSIARIDFQQTKVVNGVTFYRALESNLTFNPFAACYFTDHCNLREIITHEMGHALGLHHSWDSSFPGTPSASDQAATMYWVAHFDGRCASLRTDDINGIIFIYPGAGGSGPLTVGTATLPNGAAGTAYSQTLSASGGSLPYGWSLVAGLGSLPTGLSLSAGGVISGTPSAAGTYNFTVKVTDAAPATTQKALSIIVTAAGAAAFDAQFVSQNTPITLLPGQSFDVNMKFLNTGTQTWSSPQLYLASQNPALNSVWGGNGVSLSAFVVNPGQQLNVTFTAFSPTTPGTYNFQWQMYLNDGTGFFGQPSTNVAILVASGPPPPVDNAAFVTQSVPTSMTAGGTVNVSVTMSNTGTTTWAAGTYFLGSQNPAAGMTWGLNRVNLASAVAPGGQGAFTFNVTAPSTAGQYNFQWQMSNGASSFGSLSTNIPVTVSAGSTGHSDKIGLYNPAAGGFFLRNSNTGGTADVTFSYGPGGLGWIPLFGDWDGNGVTTIGLYDPVHGSFFLRNSNTAGATDITFAFGPGGLGWVPLVGDWNGDGIDTIGLYDPAHGSFFLRNSNSAGAADITFSFGPAGLGWVPLVGDWNGDGIDTVGLYDKAHGSFFLKNSNTGGAADISFSFGPGGLGWIALVGDWNGDGTDTIGLYDPAHGGFFLRNSNSGGVADITFNYGPGGLGWVPITGDWNGL